MNHLPSYQRNTTMRNRRFSTLLSLLFLLFPVPVSLHARAIYFDTPVVSRGYDFATDHPLGTGKNFGTDQLPIWASTIIHGALPDTKVTISLYYMHKTDGKSPLYEEEVYVSGTKPVIFRISEEKAEYFPSTEYIVEFKTDSDQTVSARFHLAERGRSSHKNISKHTSEKDGEILKSTMKNYKELEEEAQTLRLYRQESPDGSFSLILPTSWKRYAVAAPVHMHYKGKQGDLSVTRICIDDANRKKFTPEKILKIYSVMLMKDSKILYPPKIVSVSLEEAYLRFATVPSSDKNRTHRYVMMQYLHGIVTTIVMESPSRFDRFAKMLSTLAIASLENIRNICTGQTGRKTEPVIKETNSPKKFPRTHSGTIKQNKCQKPLYSEDKKMLSTLIRNNPVIARHFRSFPVKRYEDPQTGVSMIIPSRWKKSLHPDEDTLYNLNGTIGKHNYEVELKKLSDQKTFKSFSSPRALVSVFSETIIDALKKELAKENISVHIEVPTSIMQIPAGIASYAYLALGKEGRNIRLIVMVAYDGRDIYTLLISSKNPDKIIDNFLLSLAMYSLWTPENCR